MPAQSPLPRIQAGGRWQSWHCLGLSWRCVLSRDGARCSSSLSTWQGEAFLGQILPWMDSSHVDSKNPVVLCPGQLHVLGVSRQYTVLAHGAPSWITIPHPYEAWTQALVVMAGETPTCSRLQPRQ